MDIPQVNNLLPELVQFVEQLSVRQQSGEVGDWPAFSQQVRAFFTPVMMARVERVVPGWGRMSGYNDQQTLIHVTGVLVALRQIDEYRQLTPRQQALMDWIVLFHDVAKAHPPGKRDFVHAFRSAAITGRALAAVGFPVTDDFAAAIGDWAALTHNATIYRADLDALVLDNRQLPAIMIGIDRLYGGQTPAGLIIKGVLLHQSITTITAYPSLAPLTADETRRYIDAPFYPLLKVMTLADSYAWQLYDPPGRQLMHQETLDAFERVAALIGL